MPPSKLTPSLNFTRPNLADAVADYLRDIILRGDFGHRLPGERTLAGMLKVSRSSLRLALARLSAEGLVTRSRCRTTRVVAKRNPAKAPDRKLTEVGKCG